MSNHTSEIWKAIFFKRSQSWAVEKLDGDSRFPIAQVKTEANAHLIAAAPEMLAALKAAVRIENLWTYSQHDQVPDEYVGEAQALSKMLSNFKALIAKAEGSAK